MRPILTALFALAVLLAPAVTSVGVARAAVADHQMQMMQAGHCQSAPSQDHQKSGGTDCCVSICMGVAQAPLAPAPKHGSQPQPPVSRVPSLHLAHLGEIATPPPRSD